MVGVITMPTKPVDLFIELYTVGLHRCGTCRNKTLVAYMYRRLQNTEATLKLWFMHQVSNFLLNGVFPRSSLASSSHYTFGGSTGKRHCCTCSEHKQMHNLRFSFTVGIWTFLFFPLSHWGNLIRMSFCTLASSSPQCSWEEVCVIASQCNCVCVALLNV